MKVVWHEVVCWSMGLTAVGLIFYVFALVGAMSR